MKVKGRERIAFNFKDLLKSFFGNGEAYISEDEIENEVNEIISQEDTEYISNLEKTAGINTGKKDRKRGKKLDVNHSQENQIEKNSSIKEREEER